MLYEVLKTAKMGAGKAPDLYTALLAKNLRRDGEVKTLSGAPPLSFQANGQPLLDYLISGNTVQNGTPTPDSPVMPQGTGERTGNLWDESTIEVGGLDISTGAEVANRSRRCSGFIKVTPSTAYTLARVIDTTKSNLWVIGYDANKNVISDSTETRPTVLTSIGENSAASSFDTTPTTEYIRWYVTANGSYSDMMLNLGSTALPYEPYGYKIPISSNSTTTPVYLGEVESTRRIKKYEFTGQETWGKSQSTNTFYIQNTPGTSLTNRNLTMCSHFEYTGQTKGAYGTYYTPPTSVHQFNFVWNESATVEEWKSYLAQQYAAGTPVCVWYVLSTSQTAVVNEPLMRIGDYADTVSMEQTGIEILTSKGTNTIDVLTDVKPSEVYIKYKS